MVHRFVKRKVKTIWGDLMKEFIKNLLIILSTPIYLLAMFVMCIIWISKKVGDNIMDLVNEWIDFMKDDYKEIYEVVKKYGNRKKIKKLEEKSHRK